MIRSVSLVLLPDRCMGIHVAHSLPGAASRIDRNQPERISIRWALGSLCLLLCLIGADPIRAREDRITPPASDCAVDGRWFTANMVALFETREYGEVLMYGTSNPESGCDRLQVFIDDYIHGPPCQFRSGVRQEKWDGVIEDFYVDVNFVTPTLGILTMLVMTWSTPTHADTCVAWDAVPVHVVPLDVKPQAWGRVKALFR